MLNCRMNVSDFFLFPEKISGVSPRSLPVCRAGAATAAGAAGAGAAIITRGCGAGDGNLCGVNGGGDGTLSPSVTASSISRRYSGSFGAKGFSGSLSWMSSPYWSCASRIGSSGCACSGDGSSDSGVLGGDTVSLELSSAATFRAAMNGEMEGSPDKGGRFWVATTRSGADVDGRSSSSAKIAYRL